MRGFAGVEKLDGKADRKYSEKDRKKLLYIHLMAFLFLISSHPFLSFLIQKIGFHFKSEIIS